MNNMNPEKVYTPVHIKYLGIFTEVTCTKHITMIFCYTVKRRETFWTYG